MHRVAPITLADTAALIREGQHPSSLLQNCSGKHAGFLAWCVQHGQPVTNYLAPAHPLQQAIDRLNRVINESILGAALAFI